MPRKKTPVIPIPPPRHVYNMWRDVTSYSQRDEKRIPERFELRTPSLRIVVGRHIDYPGKWTISCYDLGVGSAYPRELVASELEAAKLEALDNLLALLQRQEEELRSAKAATSPF